MTRVAVKLLVGALVGGAALGIGASPAAAHGELLSSEPSSGQVLNAPPEQVVLHFNEAVDPPNDAIEVFDSSGDQLDVGDVTRSGSGSDVAVSLPAIDDGAYVVTWRVTSADSHPIRGGFVFRVGEAGGDAEAQALMERLVAGEGGDSTVGVVYGVVRFLLFVGMVLLVGGAAFIAVLWPGGVGDRRVRLIVGAGWLTTLLATVLSFGLQAAYAAGEPLGSAVDTSLIGDVLGTRAGPVWLVRLALLAIAVLAGRWLLRRQPPAEAGAAGLHALPRRWRRDGAQLAAVGGLGIALLATISWAGHAGSGDLVPLGLVVDVLHLAAVSFWLGGLAALFLVVLRRPDPDEADLEPVVAGFSTLAFAAVVTIVVTGTIQGTRQIQGFGALFDTTYGRLLIVKVLAFAALIGVAGLSRRWVRRRWPGESPSEPVPVPVGVGAGVDAGAVDATAVDASGAVASSDGGGGDGPGAKAMGTPFDDGDRTRPRISSLRRSVGVEAGIAAVVLAVTALLVNAVPAVDDYAPTFTAELHGADLLVLLEIDPAKAGRTDVQVETLSHLGEPLEVPEITASLTLPARDIGPIPLALEPDESRPGRYVAPDTDIPFEGTWELTVTARISEFDENEVVAEVPVR